MLVKFLKLFGSGVILATAFVHMLVPSAEMLSNPCLPQVFRDYQFTGVFVMTGIFLTHAVQLAAAGAFESSRKENSEDNTLSHGHECSDDIEDHNHGMLFLRKEKQLTAFLLELGVVSHSVIVGITLGVSTDEFKSLFIALSFHQFFEGVALSAVVVEAGFDRIVVKVLMVAFYTLTTPIGIAVGMGIRESFHTSSTASLLTQGILDAVSSGILMYDALVNVILPHFKDIQFHRGNLRIKLCQLLAMYLGATCMSLIGYWL